MNTIKVSITSQQPLFRQGIERLLCGIQDMEALSFAADDGKFLSSIDDCPPDVAVLDIDGFIESSLSLARQIKQHLPSVGIVLMSSNHNDEHLFQALRCQTSAYLDKETNVDRLVDTIRRVARGEHPINDCLADNPKVAERVLDEFQELCGQSEAEDFTSPLTPRETEILNHIARGYLNKQIAHSLGISEQTIKNHVTSILRKLNANARTEAVVLAIKRGLISIS